MKIGIDVSSLVYQTGVSQYTKNLVQALVDIDKEDEFVLFGGSLRKFSKLKNLIDSYFQSGNLNKKILPIPPFVLDFIWNRLHKFPIEKFTGKIDVFHSSDWTQPPTSSFCVTTIHDLAPIRLPHLSHPKIVAVHKRRLYWVRKEVDRIITPSSFTKKEAVELLEIDPKKIEVIPEAVDKDIRPVADWKVKEALRRFKIEGDYLLAVGADPRKNIAGIASSIKKLGENIKLVVVGRPWGNFVKDSSVMFVGHVKIEDLSALYCGAKALLYVSFYEGFGLPILEAMKLGCPVVTSNLSSMPHVAGDAAVLVNPGNADDIAKGIDKILSERSLWIRKGKERAKQFSWIDTAKLTLKVYREATKI